MSIASPVTLFGGKSKLAQRIIEYFPEHSTYVEVFGGSAAVLLAKKPVGVEIYNDIDGELVNLFRVLREPVSLERLHRALESTLYSRAEFELAKLKSDDPVESARRFVVRQRQSRCGLGESWSYCIRDAHAGVASAIKRWQRGIDHLPAVHSRFKNVQVECDDWRRVFPRYDSRHTLFFADPPYHPSTRVGGSYNHELSKRDHRELVARLLTIRGMVVLSGYDNEDYKPLERAGWKRVSFDVPANISDNRTRRTECLWLSPSASSRKPRLFLTPLERMSEGARVTHKLRMASTTNRLVLAIERLRSKGQKITIVDVARAAKVSREHVGRNYRHLFTL